MGADTRPIIGATRNRNAVVTGAVRVKIEGMDRQPQRSPWRCRSVRSLAVVVAGLLLAACAPSRLGDTGGTPQPQASPPASATRPPLIGPPRNVPTPPDGHAYFGVQLDWSTDTPASYAARLGRAPAVYGRFASFPLSDADTTLLTVGVEQIAAQHAMFDLTLKPDGGLETVTPASATALAATLAEWNRLGVDVLLRFAHEMNGTWYSWGQRPIEYIKAYRMIADAVHKVALKTVMVWSPNQGGGYPYTGGQYSAQPGTADFAALDTNHDGRLTGDDDAYSPYYPGDNYADWVALSLYSWGCQFPWGKNLVPEPNKFIDQVTGTFADNHCTDDRALQNFYALFAQGHHKPMALSETGALYNEAQAGIGASALDIKKAWMSQVLDPKLSTIFPLLKEENWFEFHQFEASTQSMVDWRLTTDPAVLQVLKSYLGPRFILAPIAQ